MRECSIRTCPFTTDSPLGMRSHARKHRNDFEKAVGRAPEDYAEVRRLFNTDWTPDDYGANRGAPTTLAEFGGGASA